MRACRDMPNLSPTWNIGCFQFGCNVLRTDMSTPHEGETKTLISILPGGCGNARVVLVRIMLACLTVRVCNVRVLVCVRFLRITSKSIFPVS